MITAGMTARGAVWRSPLLSRGAVGSPGVRRQDRLRIRDDRHRRGQRDVSAERGQRTRLPDAPPDGVSGAEQALAGLAGLVAERIAQRPPGPRRVALTRQEAAEALGVSVDHLERYVLGELRVIHCGRLVLVPVGELDRWANEHAVYALKQHQVRAVRTQDMTGSGA